MRQHAWMECDHLVVGTGSAGCVLANRLSEDGDVEVLTLEAGPPDRSRDIAVPAAWLRLFKSDSDWAFETAPDERLGGRTIFFPRGKTLGGSSSINAQIHLRGDCSDFDAWSAFGNPGWSYEEVLPYFRRSEHREGEASPYRGTDGPLNVRAPEDPHPFSRAFLEAGVTLGLPPNDDFNGPRLEGVGYCEHTRKKGRRHSCAGAYLHPAAARPNLRVATGVQVTRVLFEGERAVGVECRHEGELREVRCRREVILASGAVGSPQLLMLSGIGPADELRRLGIEVRQPHEGVGRHLQDHPIAPLLVRCPKPISLLAAMSLPSLARYLLFHEGMLASSGVEALAHVRTRDELAAPDLQILLMGALWLGQGLEAPREHGFTVAVVGLEPRSRGRVRLRSADPSAAPSIEPGYLSDPEGEDLRVLVEGLRLGRRMVAEAAFDGLRGGELAPGPEVTSGEDLAAYVRSRVQTYYHPVGTCRMGPNSDSVVDPELRVHGLRGLRVADASVMPRIPRANTNAATVMIAEKAADLIRGRAQGHPG